VHEDITREDLEALRARGIPPAEFERQRHLLAHPPRPLHLERPCTRGDGIVVLEEASHAACLEAWERARDAGRLFKFVPASGAASRMFQAPLACLAESPVPTRRQLRERAQRDDVTAGDTLTLLDNLERFAFHEELQRVLQKHGPSDASEVESILTALLTAEGLDYANLPKGLLAFHHSPEGPRTAFEEHLAEAARYANGPEGCRLHFTVSPRHRRAFEQLAERLKTRYDDMVPGGFDILFSVQKPHTDMIALDLDNHPFRLSSGELLFRPGGHGALIDNLGELRGDIVFIKNIDNVTTVEQSGPTILWKKLLAGTLLMLQEQVFHCIQQLEAPGQSSGDLEEAVRLVREVLGLPIPDTLTAAGPEDLRLHLLNQLKRPLRVCGMVRNTGEPGGGPFWVRGSDGGLSRQIVERDQIDPASVEQQECFASGTHFNPVDLVCGLRDHRSEPYDLQAFIDPDAVFLSRKSSEGRALKALERPGLWNGAMAHWLTVFVDVPLETFNPVKTVLDLLRPAHQPRV
jgi:hypothetical protein